FDTEAVGRPEEAGFDFNSFFFFNPNFELAFEIEFEPVLADATLSFALFLGRLESVSLIPNSFCLRGLTLSALRLRVAKWCFYNRLGVACQFSCTLYSGFYDEELQRFAIIRARLSISGWK